MDKIIDNHFLELLKTLTFRIQLSLKGGNMGSKRSKAVGSSVEFSDYREYMPGDDFRRIDWNAYARFEKVFIKLFMQEMESPVTVFLDKSESMKAAGKKETAIKIAATFSYTALADYDTLALTSFDATKMSSLTGLRGSNSFNRVIDFLEKQEFSGESDLYETLYKWQPKFRKGITIIVSDFMYDHQIEKVLRLLKYNKQKVVLCHVLSNEEINPVFDENVQIIDSETGEHLDVDTGIEAINLYKKTLKNYLDDLKAACRQNGADYIFTDSNEPIEAFIKQMQSIN